MATTNLSAHGEVPSAKGMKIAIITAKWNSKITFSLRDAAAQTLKEAGMEAENISHFSVPGSFELISAAHLVATKQQLDAIICLGCVIQGETPHFTYICEALAANLPQVSIQTEIPVIFGVLTTSNEQQALDRSGGKLGNKGVEAAVTAIEMVDLKRKL